MVPRLDVSPSTLANYSPRLIINSDTSYEITSTDTAALARNTNYDTQEALPHMIYWPLINHYIYLINIAWAQTWAACAVPLLMIMYTIT